MTESVYDYICSIGELIDKLSIENVKCYDANNKIIALRREREVDVQRIADLEAAARGAGEQRVRLRDEFNRRLAEAIARGGFSTTKETRTYDG